MRGRLVDTEAPPHPTSAMSARTSNSPRTRGEVKAAIGADALPAPTLPAVDKTYGIMVTGIGGTGIVTVGAILAMAAHLDGKAAGVIDMAGLAQKGGSVHSHIRIAARPQDIHAIRLAAQGADLVLGGDLVIAAGTPVLATVKPGATRLVVNTAEVMPGTFTKNPDLRLPAGRLRHAINEAAGAERCRFLDATRLATALFGQSIGANFILLGCAYQLGAVPLSAEAIERAIALNGEAVEDTIAAFRFGRRAALDPAAEALLAPPDDMASPRHLSGSLDEILARRVAYLTAYQNAATAERYRVRVEAVRAIEAERTPGQIALTEATAKSLFKLMAVKDEYEVARLWSDGSFVRQLRGTFAGERLRVSLHLAPPGLSRKDRHGVAKKLTFRPWIFPVLGVLAQLKGLRGTPLDPFGWSAERRAERALVGEYETVLDEVLAGLGPDNHALAVALAAVPEKIRGFGHVKMRTIALAKAEEAMLLAEFRAGPAALLEAAE
jgi:indolepyruvate ferredoxin oxidoreductase